MLAASQVFVVGVKVTEEDAHVWNPLRSSRGSLFYVGPEPEPFLQWAQEHRRRDAYHLADSFEEALPRIVNKVLRVSHR